MGFIFDFLGSIFGYILWFFYDAVSNYAGAITIFVLVMNVIMFPLAIKRQKSMARNARLSVKQKEIQKRCGKDRKKLEEEMSKLYQQEGVNPFGGCLSVMILPLVLWGGIYGAITKPLQNTLHIPQDKINQATSVISTLPQASGKIVKGYEQLQLVRMFDEIKPHLSMFNEKELSSLEEYSKGFNFLGINLLNRPNNTSFAEMLWVIPILSFVVSAFSMYITQKANGSLNQAQGAMKIMPYTAFLFTAYIAYTIPGAVGLYWVINSFIGMLQGLVLNKYYNVSTLNAHDEAVRYAVIKEKDSSAHRIKKPEDIKFDFDNIVPIKTNYGKKGKR